MHTSTNMNNPGIGLNTQSGKIAFFNQMSSHLVINTPRSVHSASDWCVESVIQS